mgnify:CR=1 FL=1
MNQQPKVSVVVPIYNVEPYLERCIQSLLNQSLKDIEIILVDDGSPDHCPQMCDEYAQKDSRIKVIHKDNAGLGFARNSGLEIATGEYVAFVDSDDYIEFNMYEELYDNAKKQYADIVFGGFYTEYPKGVWTASKEVNKIEIFQSKEIMSFLLDMIACAPSVPQERKYEMSVWHSIYKKEIIDKYNIRFLSEKEIASEDIPFQIDFLSKATKIIYVPKNYYYYCLNCTSLTKTVKPEKFEAFKQLLSCIQKKINTKEGNLRAQRLFIGYSRVLLTHIIYNRLPYAEQHLNNIMSDSIWNIIFQSYRYSYFNSWYQKWTYFLIIHKQIKLFKLSTLIKKRIKP